MCKTYAVTVVVDNNADAVSKCDITGTHMKSPDESQRKGLFLKCATPNDNLKALTVVSGDYIYLSYRQLSTPFESNGTDYGGKYLTVTIQGTDGKIHSVRINFEYDPNWTIIEDSEVIQILSWINSNRSARQALIAGYKREAQTFANDYYTNSQSLKAAQSGTAAIDAQIQANKDAITKYGTQQAADKKSAEDLQTQIDTKNKELSALQTTLSDTNTSINSKSGEIKSCQDAIKTLEDAQSGKNTSATTYKTKMDEAKNQLTSYFANLKAECPKDGTTIDAASTAILTNNNKDDMEKQLNLIVS